MKLVIAIAPFILAIVVCGLGDKTGSDEPRSQSSNQAPQQQKTPFDKTAVRTELTNLANDLTDAAARGDTTFIANNTTDDFELTDVDGKIQNKNKALSGIKEEKSIRSWALT